MSCFKKLYKVSPEVADIYAEHYSACISKVASMTLHDLCVDFGVCPYRCDSLENFYKTFSNYVMKCVCKDEKFHHMPVQDAFHVGTEQSDIDYYIICSNYCEEDEVTYYLTLTEIENDFFINVEDSLFCDTNRIDIPNCIGDVLDKHLF